MSENILSVRLEIKGQSVREDLEEVISSVKGFRLEESGAPGPCDLLILEMGDDLQREFHLIHSIQASNLAREIFLTSPRLDSGLLIQALRAGVKEFFSQPLQKEEVKEALLKLKEREGGTKFSGKKGKKGKIINVIGSKGGVGATTVAVNLATSLTELEGPPAVALIDMNLLFGEISIFLNIEPAFDWGEVTRNIFRLDPTYLMSVLSRHPSGVYVLPSPTGLDGVNLATSEIIEKLLSLMQNLFDFIVIDGGQSMDDISLKILDMSDIVLLVAVLSLPCLTNIRRLLWTFQKLGYPRDETIKIVINRFHKKSVISLDEAEQSIKKGIFWTIPNDFLTTMSAINQGKTLFAVAPEAGISKNARELASVFVDKGRQKKEKSSFWQRITKKNNGKG